MKSERTRTLSMKITAIVLSVCAVILLNKNWISVVLLDDSVTMTASDFCKRIVDVMVSMNNVNDFLVKVLPVFLFCCPIILKILFIMIIIVNLISIFAKDSLSAEKKKHIDSICRETFSMAIASMAYVVILFICIGVYESEINNFALTEGYTKPIIDISLTGIPYMLAMVSAVLIASEKYQFVKAIPSVTSSRFCTSCGTAIPSGSSFCPVCGKAVAPVAAPTSVSASPEVLARIEEEEKRRKETLRIETTLKSGGWKCTCGRVNPSYTGTCACGNTKYK